MKLLLRRLGLMLLLAVSFGSMGLRQAVVFGQETDDPVKIETYKRFVDNRVTNPGVAYQAARDYLQKYPKDKDDYTDYLTKWVMFYERDERKRKLPGLIGEKNFAEAYKVGNRILADEPDYLRAQIDLGYAGYLAASERNETFSAEALGHAKKAIAALEAGKVPAEWAPFKGKDDTLASLYYAVGYLSIKSAPDQAIEPLLKSTQFDSDIKKKPFTYYFIAVAYETGPYKTQSAAFQAAYANKPETPESKAALEKINVVIDRMIDAYARAIAAAGTEQSAAASKNEWMAKLTAFWKFRHEGTDTGLNEFVASALSRPLPPKP
jgi:hypothetical protein